MHHFNLFSVIFWSFLDIYRRETKMEMIMKKEKHNDEKQSIEDILLDIKYRLEHIEDITADDRTLIVKLIKQSNTVVEFLKDLQIDEVVDDYPSYAPSIESEEKSERLKNLLDEFMDKKESLKELEKELKKHRLMITPGQVGEA